MTRSRASHRAAPQETFESENRVHRRRSLRQLAKRLGHTFADLGLLDRALTHSSTGNDGKQSYERLEFLGDAVLGFLVADLLFEYRPEVEEGHLTDRRARIVSKEPLAEVADALGLVDHLEVGRGIREQDRRSPRIRADLVEAVLGAIYLDGGVRAARKFVRAHVWKRHKDRDPAVPPQRDPKSRLLHHVQTQGLELPVYEVVATSGPAHQRTFVVAVRIAGEVRAEGSGPNKQSAEKLAAERALAHFLTADPRGLPPQGSPPASLPPS